MSCCGATGRGEELPCDVRWEGSYEQRADGFRVSCDSRAKIGAFDARLSVTAAGHWRSIDGDTAGVFGTTGLIVTTELQRVRPEREAEMSCLCNRLRRCCLSSSSRDFFVAEQ